MRFYGRDRRQQTQTEQTREEKGIDLVGLLPHMWVKGPVEEIVWQARHFF